MGEVDSYAGNTVDGMIENLCSNLEKISSVALMTDNEYLANKTKNCCERQKKLESVNDIVWELGHRKIITDTSLWLKLFESDKNLYWLGYKAVNMTD